MDKKTLKHIQKLLDKASKGIEEYACTLETTDVIRDPLDKIYEIVEKELAEIAKPKYDIIMESFGCCRQDPDQHVYHTTNPKKKMLELFVELLEEAEFTEDEIKKIKAEIKEEEYYEDEPKCKFDYDEAWVEFNDIYNTRTYITVV